MATLVTDPWLEDRIKAERERSGTDRYDEVWEGIYMMAPMPNDEHQHIVSRMVSILEYVIGWPELGLVRPGVNLSDHETDWKQDYRVPDVAVFLREGKAQNCGTHWRGEADFLVDAGSVDHRAVARLEVADAILPVADKDFGVDAGRLDVLDLHVAFVGTAQRGAFDDLYRVAGLIVVADPQRWHVGLRRGERILSGGD